MSAPANTNNTAPVTVTETKPTTTTQSQDNAWIEPYYKLNKDELTNQVDPVTLNQIRNTIGDQKFIDQWKLSEADYNKIIEGQKNHTTTTTSDEPLKEYIPTSTIYASGVHPAGNVRRIYSSGHHGLYGGHYGARSYYGGYQGGYPSYYGGVHGSYYGGYPYHHSGVTRVVAADEGLRRSVVRTDAPTVISSDNVIRPHQSVTRLVAQDSTLRSSYVGAPVTRLAPYSTVIPAENTLRSSYVGAPLTRVHSHAPYSTVIPAENTLSYVGAPVTRVHAHAPYSTVIPAETTLRSSYVGAPLRSSVVRADAPVTRVAAPVYTGSTLGGSYIRSGVSGLRHSSYIAADGLYPTTSYPATTLRSSAYHHGASYYPNSSRVISHGTPVATYNTVSK
jgi:hypothetical protein